MSREILADILHYLDHLNASGYYVCVNFLHRRFQVFHNQAFAYIHHLHPVCNFFRFGIRSNAPCPKCWENLLSKKLTDPAQCCCNAGVEEWAVPIFHNKELLAYVRIYGYQSPLPANQSRREKLLQKYGEELACWYGQLSADFPSPEQVRAFVRPLHYMFAALYQACEQPQLAASYGSRELYLNSMNLIVQKYMSPLTVQILADWQNCSPSYLQQVFRREGNTSVHAAIRKIRLERAEALLRVTRLTITHIANRCGFPDSNYFCVAFKEHYGLSPTKYRAQCREHTF